MKAYVIPSYHMKARVFLQQAQIPISGLWIDCGCGQGHYLEALLYLGADTVIGIDILISGLNRKSPGFYICGDCRNLPLKDATGSGFLCVNVLHYCVEPLPLLEEACRVVESGGMLILIEYDQEKSTRWNPYPLSGHTLKLLLNKSGFSYVRTVRVDTQYRPKNLMIGKKE
ncbi:MAG: class I SAM-dependent methyltransferase [Theionarchaea archaeon]|nr:class I SAM-dependent methyltransferase [Theionarchaea archaeon]